MQLKYFGSAARRPGLEVRGVDAFEPVANLHRCYLRRDSVPGGAQGGQALLLRAPPAGRRAPGRLRVRPAAQQLLGKVGLLRTAAAAGTEQRAASAATVQCDRAAPGRAGLSARSALP